MAIKIEENVISLAVRDLIPATNNSQILSSFPMPQRGALGRQAQTWLQKGKKDKLGMFHTEYALSRQYSFNDYKFHINGRIDGVYKLQNKAEIEEIKSVILKKNEFSKVSAEIYPHFIQQLFLYCYLLQDELAGIDIKPFLILVNLVDYKQKVFPLEYKRPEVENFLHQRFNEIINRIEEEQNEIGKRKAELKLIDFSLPEDRPQQKAMIDKVAQVLQQKEHLLVSAPTGTGKTAAALYPAIKYAYARNKRIIIVTSKTSQQEIVKETVQKLLNQDLSLKVVFLKASQKMCANDIYFCHEAHCRFAQNYRQRLEDSDLLNQILQKSLITPDDVFIQAKNQELCPFEVNLDVSVNCDIIVGDYNYVFDPAVQLRRLFSQKDASDWILIIDEAHNLYDRGRGYLSPRLDRQKVSLLSKSLKINKGAVYKDIQKALKEALVLFDKLQQEGEASFTGQQYFETDLNIVQWEDVFNLFESKYIAYLIYKIRKGLLIPDDPLEMLYFTFRRFIQVARYKDPSFVTYYSAEDGGVLHIKCCDPALYLGNKIDSFHSTIAMSATLDPLNYYKNVLGFPDPYTQLLSLDSPFPKKNRKLLIVPSVSTRYRDRSKNYQKIAEIIKETCELKEGNYLAFFPSYDFLQNVNIFLGNLKTEKILQRPGMREEDRNLILENLKSNSQAHLILAVMGGLFSEGVDFKGDMAIGVFVVSPALPKFSYEQELLNRYYEEKCAMGREYAYLYPGMNKVIQAAGRLIRSFTDKGIVLLIGERFAEDDFNILLPDYWFESKNDIEITIDYKKAVQNFWKYLERNSHQQN